LKTRFVVWHPVLLKTIGLGVMLAAGCSVLRPSLNADSDDRGLLTLFVCKGHGAYSGLVLKGAALAPNREISKRETPVSGQVSLHLDLSGSAVMKNEVRQTDVTHDFVGTILKEPGEKGYSIFLRAADVVEKRKLRKSHIRIVSAAIELASPHQSAVFIAIHLRQEDKLPSTVRVSELTCVEP